MPGKSPPLENFMSKLAVSQIGDVKVKRGTVVDEDGENELLYYSWDFVHDCLQTECPGFGACTYTCKKSKTTTKCPVSTQYLKAITTVIHLELRSKMNQIQLMKVGLHLMPLYAIMSRLLIEEMGVRHVATENVARTVRVHPVFKEIRDTMSAIDKAWTSIGLNMPVGGSGGLGSAKSVREDGHNPNGQRSYYDDMKAGHTKKKD